MKKKRFLMVVIFTLIAFLLLFFLRQFTKNKNTDKHWQFLITDQIGAQSILNVGKNLTFDEKLLYFCDGKGLIHALDKKTGQVHWTTQIENHSPFEITQDDSHIYVSSFDHSIYKISKKDGSVVWKYFINNFFWPDTEVVFDQNDENIFFADRGGFLYALNKDNGQEIWKKEFGAIDNTKIFTEGSIHFGFIKQTDDDLLVDHFPSKTLYTIDKKTGEIRSQKQSELQINLTPKKNSVIYGNLELRIKNNVISQPKLELVDKNQKLIWIYQTEHKVNADEIYQDEERIYYLSANNTILESIKLDGKDPNKNPLEKINFKLTENFAVHHPFKNSNPQVDAKYQPPQFATKIKTKINDLAFILQNFKQLFLFKITNEVKKDFVEFTIEHEDEFYVNKFTELKVEATFKNKSDGSKKVVKGFYDDKNTWKIRAKLEKGNWDYQIKIKTPFFRKTIKGSLIVENEFKNDLKITGNSFTINDKLFIPIGIQDVIADSNKDGNPLNDMGFAKQATPPTEKRDYSFTDLNSYLDTYKKEAGMNIFRYGPDNWAPPIWKDLSSNDTFAMDLSGNKKGDAIIEMAREKEYRVMMSIFAFYPPYISKEAFEKKENQKVLTTYLDYIIARYATSIDVWEIANEAIPSLEWQNFISNYLYENDPYQHPITTSLEETRLVHSDLLSIHHYPPSPKSNQELVTQIEKLENEQSWSKAKIISEFGFAKTNYFTGSADTLRKTAWIFTMQKMGLITWNTGFGFFENKFNGNIYVGPEERFYLKIITDFMPIFSSSAINEKRIDEENGIVIYGLKDEAQELYYILKTDLTKTTKELSLNAKKDGAVVLLNPKTGQVIRKESLPAGTDRKIALSMIEDDLVIKIIYN